MKALAEDRIFLTLDLDFGDLALLTREPAARVILFRLENTRTIHVIERLETVLAGSSDALARGAVVIVEEGRQRIRYLSPHRGDRNVATGEDAPRASPVPHPLPVGALESGNLA
jgi:Domain of unknown function (DUF5615)